MCALLLPGLLILKAMPKVRNCSRADPTTRIAIGWLPRGIPEKPSPPPNQIVKCGTNGLAHV